MKIDEKYIEFKIVGGPDRMGLAIGLFDLDMDTVTPVTFTLEPGVESLKRVSVQLHSMERESGGQARQWCFTGFINDRTKASVESSGMRVSLAVTGYYNLANREGWIRFHRA